MNKPLLLFLITVTGPLVLDDERMGVDRVFPDGQRAVVRRDTVVEHHPTVVDRRDDGSVLIRGGDVRMDVAYMAVFDTDAPSSDGSTAWIKAHTLSLGPDLGPEASSFRDTKWEVRRLRIYDVSRIQDELLVAYSKDGQVCIDFVARQTDEQWHIRTTVILFEQQASHAAPRIVRSAHFVKLDEDIFLHFDVFDPHRDMEIWKISPLGGTEVDDEDLRSVVLKAVERKHRVPSDDASKPVKN